MKTGLNDALSVHVSQPPTHAALQLLSHLHASLGDELTEPSSVSKLPDSAQVCVPYAAKFTTCSRGRISLLLVLLSCGWRGGVTGM
jgi:hypothetical protein